MSLSLLIFYQSFGHPFPIYRFTLLQSDPTRFSNFFHMFLIWKQKSLGFDCLNLEIHICVVKHIAKAITPMLTHIINFCFQNGVFPKQSKVSVIVLMYKISSANNDSYKLFLLGLKSLTLYRKYNGVYFQNKRTDHKLGFR